MELIPKMVGILFLCIVILFFVVFTLVMLMVLKKRYRQAAIFFIKLPLADRSGVFTPPEVSFILIKSDLLIDAEGIIRKDMNYGVFPVHYLMQILLFSKWGKWSEASNAYNSALVLSKNENLSSEDTGDFDMLYKFINEQDSKKIEDCELFKNYENDFLNKVWKIYSITIVMIALIIFLFSLDIFL